MAQVDPKVENDAIVAALRRIIRAVDLQSKRLAQRYGLTGPQIVVLQRLVRHGPQTTGDLAAGVFLGQATVSEMLERLEARKLIRRRPGRKDRRSVINEITRSGAATVKGAPPLLQESFARELRRLEDWERGLILATLQRVAKMMDAEDIDASPVLVSGPIAASAQKTAAFHDEGETGARHRKGARSRARERDSASPPAKGRRTR
jgi:DNA-binding MarR family transcriptional regulator